MSSALAAGFLSTGPLGKPLPVPFSLKPTLIRLPFHSPQQNILITNVFRVVKFSGQFSFLLLLNLSAALDIAIYSLLLDLFSLVFWVILLLFSTSYLTYFLLVLSLSLAMASGLVLSLLFSSSYTHSLVILFSTSFLS